MASAQETSNSLSKSLRTASEVDRKKIVGENLAARSAEIKGVVAIVVESVTQLRKCQRMDAKSVEWHAARLLGEARTPEAIPVCLKLVAVRDSNFEPDHNQFDPHWRHFPFAVALANIGMPAVAPLLKQIQSSTSSNTEFHVSCVTLEAILGKDLGTSALKHHAKQFPESGQAGWLEAALKLVDTGHFRWEADTARDFRYE